MAGSEATPNGQARLDAEHQAQNAGLDAPLSASTIRWEQGEDGIVVLTLDDPNQSANTMNAAYAESMAATVERLEAEKDEIAGVVITSAKKTFFAGGDLNLLKQASPENAPELAEMVRCRQGAAASPRDARQARRRRDQRRRARRWPGDRARDPPPHRRR